MANPRSLNLDSTHGDLKKLFRKGLYCFGVGISCAEKRRRTVCTEAELNAGKETGKREGILPGSIQLKLCIGGQQRN